MMHLMSHWFSCQSAGQAVFGLIVIFLVAMAFGIALYSLLHRRVCRLAAWLDALFFGKSLPPICIGRRHGCDCASCRQQSGRT